MINVCLCWPNTGSSIHPHPPILFSNHVFQNSTLYTSFRNHFAIGFVAQPFLFDFYSFSNVLVVKVSRDRAWTSEIHLEKQQFTSADHSIRCSSWDLFWSLSFFLLLIRILELPRFSLLEETSCNGPRTRALLGYVRALQTHECPCSMATR